MVPSFKGGIEPGKCGKKGHTSDVSLSVDTSVYSEPMLLTGEFSLSKKTRSRFAFPQTHIKDLPFFIVTGLLAQAKHMQNSFKR